MYYIYQIASSISELIFNTYTNVFWGIFSNLMEIYLPTA